MPVQVNQEMGPKRRQGVKNPQQRNPIPLSSMILANVQPLKSKVDNLRANVSHRNEYKSACLLASSMDLDSALDINGFGVPLRLDLDSKT